MAQTPLYSRSPRGPRAAPPAAEAGPPPPSPGPLARMRRRAGGALRRHERWAWALGGLLLALLAGAPGWLHQAAPVPTFEQIDAAVRESIAKEPLPSAVAAAYETILPSVVRVVGEHDAPPPAAGKASGAAAARPPASASGSGKAEGRDGKEPHAGDDERRSVGTGVVIVDKGLILTNLHVVSGADRVKVTFFDGLESEAQVVNLMPEHDLAVLQARTIPDDLHAATMRSTGGLQPGDHVLAVGFPFGIGPSASAGVVSGLKREFRSPQGQRVLTNLIQFDAAANPGNSGGPLVTMDGNVVGIVTAIMNPNHQRTFIGIAFAVPIENAAAGAGLPPF